MRNVSYGVEHLRQTLATTPGTTYTLTFALAGNPGGRSSPNQKTGDLQIGSTTYAGALDFDTTGQSRTDMGWATKSYTFTATGTSTPITFTSTTGGGAGPVITNVSMEQPPTAGIPMADPMVLGGLVAAGGLVLTGAFVARRHRAQA